MFESEMRIEVERRVIKALDERTKAGLPAVGLDSLRAIVRNDLTTELEAKRQSSVRVVSPPPSPPAPVIAKPTPAPPVAKPTAPMKVVAPAPSPIVLAERARAQRIIAMTPKGAEAEAHKAIASGMPVAEFEGVLAARAILNARRRAQGA